MQTKKRHYGLLLVLIGLALGGLWMLPSRAQDIAREVSFDTLLKVAYVSNQDGDEDIYVIPWNGWQGWAGETAPINLTLNDQRARDWDPMWSPDGAQIMFTSDRDGLTQIYLMNADGTRTRSFFTNSTSNDLSPAWSPDGTQVAFISDRNGIGRDIFIANRDGSNVRAVTTTGTIKGDPAWSPDGSRISYWERIANGSLQIYSILISDPSRPQPLSFNGRSNGMVFWSPNGQNLFYESDRNGTFQLFSANPDGNAPRPITDGGANSGRGAISPDGSLIIFTTDRDASDELYVVSADGSSLERLTQNNWSDHSPVWQPAVPPLTTEASIVVAAPTVEPTAQAGTGEAGGNLGSIGQSAEANNIEIFPINLQTLKNEYGIEAWHQAGWRGQGMRIGVIDLGFRDLQNLENSMLQEVQIPLDDNFAEYNANASAHGTHVLEIIHAIAPDAQLYACRYDGSFEGFKRCKDFLALDQHVNVINHSAGLPVFPLNGENEWARQASDANDLTVLWVNSSGNFQQSFYFAQFSDPDGDGRHDFTATIEALRFNIEEPYSGNVILTWDKPEKRNADDPEPDVDVDLDLEIVDASGSVIATSHRRQLDPETRLPTGMSASELIPLTTDRPFAVRITSPLGYNSRAPNMALLVEYLAIEDEAIPSVFRDRSSIAPADSIRVVSVGSVRTEESTRGGASRLIPDQLAPYSSFGLAGNAGYLKPDIVAYGELTLSDGTLFFGTSAAAPVVAGAMALFWQTDDTLLTDELRARFLREAIYQPENYASITYGHGVLRMPEPPGRFGGELDLEVIPKLVFPQPDVTVSTTEVARCGGVLTRLEVGAEGYVTYHLGLGFRSGPGENYTDISFGRNLQRGNQFVVLDGPVCGGSASWWQIQLNDGSVGWVSEGEGYYLITPSNLLRAQLPQTYDYECPNAPDAEIGIGDRAVITNAPSSGLTMWHYPTRFQVIGTLAQGTELHVLGGPWCEESIATRVWYVRVLSGRWEGVQGWVSEARPNERWIARQ